MPPNRDAMRPIEPLSGIATWPLYLMTVATGGFTWFVTTYQIGPVPHQLSLVYRFGVSALLLLYLSRLLGATTRLNVRQHGLVALQGGLTFAASFSLIYLGLQFLTSGLVALLFSSVLIFNVIFSAVFLRRPIPWTVVVGAAFGTCGLIVVFAPEAAGLTFADEKVLGMACILGAALLFSAGNMLSARFQNAGIPVLQGTGLAMAYGAGFLAAIAAITGKPLVFDFGFPYVASLLYLAVFGTVVGYGAYFIVAGRIGPERAAYSIVATPVLALVVSTVLEGLVWRPNIAVGMLLVVVGNILVLSRGLSLRRSKQRSA